MNSKTEEYNDWTEKFTTGVQHQTLSSEKRIRDRSFIIQSEEQKEKKWKRVKKV